MTKILIIEDHPDTRDLIQIVLEADGHEVYEVETGEDGIEAAKRILPRIILLDISLAGNIDGLEVARRLRSDASFEQTVIVALTAHAMKDDAERVFQAGCDSYWTKPIVDFEQFSDDIQEMAKNGRKEPASQS